MTKQYEFSSRYHALGIKVSAGSALCEGLCEGTGFIPVRYDETDIELKALWLKAHKEAHSIKGLFTNFVYFVSRGEILNGLKSTLINLKCDGWHFVICPKCHGTGKKER